MNLQVTCILRAHRYKIHPQLDSAPMVALYSISSVTLCADCYNPHPLCVVCSIMCSMQLRVTLLNVRIVTVCTNGYSLNPQVYSAVSVILCTHSKQHAHTILLCTMHCAHNYTCRHARCTPAPLWTSSYTLPNHTPHPQYIQVFLVRKYRYYLSPWSWTLNSWSGIKKW
jgi:hypothetical protein